MKLKIFSAYALGACVNLLSLLAGSIVGLVMAAFATLGSGQISETNDLIAYLSTMSGICLGFLATQQLLNVLELPVWQKEGGVALKRDGEEVNSMPTLKDVWDGNFLMGIYYNLCYLTWGVIFLQSIDFSQFNKSTVMVNGMELLTPETYIAICSMAIGAVSYVVARNMPNEKDIWTAWQKVKQQKQLAGSNG